MSFKESLKIEMAMSLLLAEIYNSLYTRYRLEIECDLMVSFG